MKPLLILSFFCSLSLGWNTYAQTSLGSRVVTFPDYDGPQMNYLKAIGPIRGTLYQVACRGLTLSYKNAYIRPLNAANGKAEGWMALNLEPFKILDELEDVLVFNEGIWILFSGTNPSSKEPWLMATEIDPQTGNARGAVQALCPMVNRRPTKSNEMPMCKVSPDGRTIMAYQMGIDYFPVSAGGDDRSKVMGMNMGVWTVGETESWRKQVVLDDGRNIFDRGEAKVDNLGRVIINGVMLDGGFGTTASGKKETGSLIALWDKGSKIAKTRANPNSSPNPEFWADWHGKDSIKMATVFFEDRYTYTMGYATGWWVPNRNQLVWKSQHTWLDGFKDQSGWQASGVGKLGLTFDQLAAPEEAQVKGIYTLGNGTSWLMVEVRNPRASRDKVESRFKESSLSGFAESETETWKRIYQFAAEAPSGVFMIPLNADLTTGVPYYINRRGFSKLEPERCITNLLAQQQNPTYLQLEYPEGRSRQTPVLVQVSFSEGKWNRKNIEIAGSEAFDLYINRSNYIPGLGMLVFGVNGAQEWLGLVGF